MKRGISLLLALIILAGTVSCGSETQDVGDTSSGSGDTTSDTPTGTTAPDYDWQDLDLGGAKLSILNSSTDWGFYHTLNLDAETGDTLDDAVYRRNSLLEDRYDFEFDVTDYSINEAPDFLRKSILTGDDEYQCAFLRGELLPKMISEKLFVDLTSVPELRLDEDYWDQSLNSAARLGKDDVQYFAGTDFSLLRFGATVGVYFNKDKFDALKIDYPYDTVREGRWTLDRFGELAAQGANLNGDAKWKFDQSGNADYGFSTWYCGISGMLFGTGVSYIERDADGAPRLSIENDRFMTACSKIAGITAEEGVFIHLNDAAANYETEFGRGRLLMTIAQIKASTNLRSSEVPFGFLPMPKLDEEQADYHCYQTPVSTFFVIPATNQRVSETAAIMDAGAFLSARDVLPVYYDVTVSQKGLRDEDSIEMLNIVSASRYTDVSRIFGWTIAIYDKIENSLQNGKGDVASIIASLKEKTEKNIADTLEKLDV